MSEATIPTTHEQEAVATQVPTRAARDVRLPFGARVRRLWAARGMWLGMLAFAIALGGTLLLANPLSRPWGAFLLVVAVLVGVVAWGGQPWSPALTPAEGFRLPRLDWRLALRLVGVVAAALCTWRANSLFLEQRYEVFGGAGLLWLASMGLLLVSVQGSRLRVQHAEFKAQGSRFKVQRLRFKVQGSGFRVQNPKWGWWEVAAFAGLALLSLLLRVWDLGHYPFAVHSDEIITGREAIDAYVTGQNVSIFSTRWNYIDLPALWFFIVAGALKVGGMSLESLRLPAALFGALTIVPFYGMVRGSWGRTAALAGSAVLAFSVSNVHYSRITLNNIVTQFFWAACFFFLLRALRGRRPLDWALAGVMGGLSEHFYYGTRLLPIILVVFGVYLLVAHWRQGRQYLAHFGLLALGYLAAFGPLLAYFTTRPELYLGRKPGARPLNWDHIPRTPDDLGQMWNTLWPVMEQNLLAFSAQRSDDGFYWAALLLPAEAALLCLGVGLLIWRWRHPAAFLMLLAGGGVLFVGGTLVPAASNINHWTPAFPAFYAALAVPVGVWAASARRWLPANLRWAPSVLLATGLSLLGWMNVSYYFNQYYAVRPEFDLGAAQHRYYAELGPQYIARNLGRTWQPVSPEYAQFLAPRSDVRQAPNPASELPVPGQAGKGLAFVVFPDNEHYWKPLHQLYPGGTDGAVQNPNGIHHFLTYVIKPEQAEEVYGAYLQLLDGRGRVAASHKVPTVGSLPPGMSGAVRARWSAGVYVDTGGSWRISVEGAPARMILDGQEVALPAEKSLLPGWHRVLVEANLAGPSPLRLKIAPSGNQADEVDEVSQWKLWPTPPGGGLLGAVAGLDGQPLYRIDPFIGFTAVANPQALGPGQGGLGVVRARWSGVIKFPERGAYTLEVRTDGQARLFIAEQPVLAACSSGEAVSGQSASKEYNAGWHRIQLDYISAPNPNYLELYWTLPGGQHELVPPDALSYADEGGRMNGSMPSPPEAIDCAQP